MAKEQIKVIGKVKSYSSGQGGLQIVLSGITVVTPEELMRLHKLSNCKKDKKPQVTIIITPVQPDLLGTEGQ